MATSSEIYVGSDVAKDRLDVAVLGERQEKQVDNTKVGIAKLVQRMLELDPELIWWKPRVATSGVWWRHCSRQGWRWQW